MNIFDVNWFISSLAKDVTIVRKVPDKFMRSMEKPPYTMRVPRKSPPEYYLDQVLPILLRRHVRSLFSIHFNLLSVSLPCSAAITPIVQLINFSEIPRPLFWLSLLQPVGLYSVFLPDCSLFLNTCKISQVVQLTKFDYRLANDLDDELQKLRCRANYYALRFTKSINQLGQKLVARMREMARRYVAVHLRSILFQSYQLTEHISACVFLLSDIVVCLFDCILVSTRYEITVVWCFIVS